MLEAFESYQRYLSSSALIFALELAFFVAVLVNLLLVVGHWLACGQNLRLPVAFVVFFLVKMLSDVSLALDQPKKPVWSEIFAARFRLGYQQLFLANVDPFSGLLVTALYYSRTVGKLKRKSTWPYRCHSNCCCQSCLHSTHRARLPTGALVLAFLCWTYRYFCLGHRRRHRRPDFKQK